MLKNCIKNWKRIDDDMAANVAQRERSKIKCYASAFSNILISTKCHKRKKKKKVQSSNHFGFDN